MITLVERIFFPQRNLKEHYPSIAEIPGGRELLDDPQELRLLLEVSGVDDPQLFISLGRDGQVNDMTEMSDDELRAYGRALRDAIGAFWGPPMGERFYAVPRSLYRRRAAEIAGI